jgi:hypothetical protein
MMRTRTRIYRKCCTGYGGHIPENVSHARKARHGEGRTIRPQQLDLRLTARFFNCAPGYTGYMPHSGAHQTERITGTDVRTTSGAAAQGASIL